MNWLDVVLLVFIGVVGLAGYRTGMVQAAAALIGILVGITLASRYGGDIGSVFSPLTDSDNAQEVAGFLLVFLLVMLATLLASSLVRRVLRVLMLGWADQVGGLALGAIIAMAGASALLANVQSFPVLDLSDTIDDSFIGSFLADQFDVVLRGVRILPKSYGT